MPHTKRRSLSSFGSFSNLLGLGKGSSRHKRGGGRAPGKADNVTSTQTEDRDECSWLTTCNPNEARLTIVQITDVYTLDNFASLKTMLQTIRGNRSSKNDKVISVLTGDFLSPYLLSSIDRGKGMMNALAETPIDYVIWGNHEADIDHRIVCRHVKNFPGTWINTNMQSHEAMAYQKPYEIIEVASPDGTNIRKIGLIAVLSNDPKLYSHFQYPPGPFGGAVIEDPWVTIRKYKNFLEEEEGCDVVLPLQHLYVPDDHKTCHEFDFPAVLSGHDHHKVDEVVEGTRLIKPGMDGVYATVLEMVWKAPKQQSGPMPASPRSPARHKRHSLQGSNAPTIRSTFVETSTFEPCPVLKAQTDRAYDVLLPLRDTELIRVPSLYEPLSSKNARGCVCTMGTFICSMLKALLNQKMKAYIDPSWSEMLTEAVIRKNHIDAVILMGGNIRGGEDYPPESFFSLKMLEAEIKSDEIVAVVPIPGSVLAHGIEATHSGDPIPGWMQYDDGIQEERMMDGSMRVTMVAGKALDPNRTYRVVTKISDLRNGQSPPLKNYFTLRPKLFPAKGSYFNIQTELMSFFARNIFRKLWEATQTPHLKEEVEQRAAAIMGRSVSTDSLHDVATMKKVESRLRLAVLDQKGDGIVSIEEIHAALRNILGLSVHDDNRTLAEYVHSQADVTGDGLVTTKDFEQFCTAGGLPVEFGTAHDKWDEAFPSANNLASSSAMTDEKRESSLVGDSPPPVPRAEANYSDHQYGSDDDDVGLMI